jgi:hypothetical protein
MMAKRPNPELVKYIEHHLEKGFEIRNIKRKLADVGHPIEAIEDAAQFVLSQKPQLRKRPTTFMIVYGIIIILVVAGFAYFIWFKATQQVVYQETVQEIEKNQSYVGRTDIELLRLAASGDTNACTFIKGHNEYYACTEKIWTRGDCILEDFIGEGNDCFMKQALKSENISLCLMVGSQDLLMDCQKEVISKFAEQDQPEKCKGDPACLRMYISQKGIKNLGISFCENQMNSNGLYYLRDQCLYEYANATRDIEACNHIDETRGNKATNSTKFMCLVAFSESLADVADICKVRYLSFYEDFKGSASPLEEAKAACFVQGARLFSADKNIGCGAIKEYISANAGMDVINDYDKVYKYHLDHPEEFKERFFICD